MPEGTATVTCGRCGAIRCRRNFPLLVFPPIPRPGISSAPSIPPGLSGMMDLFLVFNNPGMTERKISLNAWFNPLWMK
jgi:hypothetical protein